MNENSSNLSILLCTDYLPPAGGGVEVVVEKLATQLANQDADVTIFTLDDGGHPPIMSVENITVERVPTIDTTSIIGLQSQLSPRSFSRLRGVVKTVNPDLIHIHNRFFFTSFTVALLNALRKIDTPLIITLHLGKIDEIRGFSGTAARIYERTFGRFVISRSDAVIAVSEAVAEYACSLGGEPTSTHVVPNGVDPAQFMPSGGKRKGNTILFVGRLVKNKGPHTLIEAIPKVLEKYPNAEFEIIGTGPMDLSLKERVSELNVEESVKFRGFVESVSDAMKRGDVFCRPSLSEGMPLTLLEAMASGLPAVVTPVAGVPEIVEDGETGVLVQPEDPDATAEALISLLKSPSLRNSMGRTAREYVVEEHSWDRRTERIKDVYESVMIEN